jgi:hypothetical protein
VTESCDHGSIALQLFTVLDEEMNSIAVVVKHMAGNMRSRWTDFLTSEGEEPDRDRDSEFVDPPPTRGALIKLWAEGWDCVFSALAQLSDADLVRTVTDPRRSALGNAGDQPADRALCLSLRPDCAIGEAFPARPMAVVERAPGGRGRPAVGAHQSPAA